jgi:MFS family permease
MINGSFLYVFIGVKNMKSKDRSLFISSAIFIVLMGIISMLSDMTHEGAKSIYGSFLSLTGATPSVISFISGFGEFISCSLILLTGFIANKSKKYWTMTIIGYMINLLAIPMLALTMENGWIFACTLMLLERVGKAIRKPAKSTLVSFSSKNLGEGKSFAFVEFLDQIGAFIGPVILTFVLHLKGSTNLLESYKTCFLVLGIPAIATLIFLFIARAKYPNPENLEVETSKDNKQDNKLVISKSFIFYLVAIGLCAAGFIDFPLITYHVENLNIVNIENLPLLYSLAMFIDAFAALLFGTLFDKYGIKVLILSTIFSFAFPLFIFKLSSELMIIIGICMWGIGMGAQESILKAAVAKLIEKENRALGFGIFEFVFGLCWFIGSYFLGIIYESSILLLVIVSMALEGSSIIFYQASILSNKKRQSSN